MQREQALAREAVSRGQIQPLDVIMGNVQNTIPGELLIVGNLLDNARKFAKSTVRVSMDLQARAARPFLMPSF